MAAPTTSATPARTFIIGSRASKLAQVQTRFVRDALATAHPSSSFDVAFMLTGGDKNKTDALYLFGSAGKALWTEELEVALLQDKTIDFIVHSLKDMPTSLPEGAVLGAIPARHDPRDSLVVKAGLEYKTLDDLPDGSVVGTSSVRRVAQLRRAYPNLVFSDMRGNIDTRLAKTDDPAGPYTAAILAHAGLERMNLEHRVTSDIVPPSLYYAVGQGALGIEIRADDEEARRLLQVLSHTPSEMRCRAERSCLHVLEGGCSVPVGVQTVYTPGTPSPSSAPSPDATATESSEASSPTSTVSDATLTLTGTVTSLSGDAQVLFTASAPMTCLADASALGERVARELIANGARAILDDVNKDRAIRDAALKAKKAAEREKNGFSVVDGVANEKADGWLAKKAAKTVPELPSETEVKSAIKSATNGTSTTSNSTSLPPNHPPIPHSSVPFHPSSASALLHEALAHPHGHHTVLHPVPVPISSIASDTETGVMLPASHPPILVTPSEGAEVPTHCLRPPTPPPADKCLRPPTPEVLDAILAGGKRKASDDEPVEPEQGSSGSGRKRRAVSGRGEMQG